MKLQSLKKPKPAKKKAEELKLGDTCIFIAENQIYISLGSVEDIRILTDHRPPDEIMFLEVSKSGEVRLAWSQPQTLVTKVKTTLRSEVIITEKLDDE